jgi:hypothetical protein
MNISDFSPSSESRGEWPSHEIGDWLLSCVITTIHGDGSGGSEWDSLLNSFPTFVREKLIASLINLRIPVAQFRSVMLSCQHREQVIVSFAYWH